MMGSNLIDRKSYRNEIVPQIIQSITVEAFMTFGKAHFPVKWTGIVGKFLLLSKGGRERVEIDWID